jgi:hypothetical protein
MERKALVLLDQLWMTEKLSECFDARVIDFGIVNRSRCIEEEDIVIEVDQCACWNSVIQCTLYSCSLCTGCSPRFSAKSSRQPPPKSTT